MLQYTMSKLKSVSKSLLGVFQHSGVKRRRDDEIVADAPRPGSVEALPTGVMRLALSGRDVPSRVREVPSEDHRAELELTGFLDKFEPDERMQSGEQWQPVFLEKTRSVEARSAETHGVGDQNKGGTGNKASQKRQKAAG